MFPDVQKYFRTYNNFSENTVVFQFTFSCPENYLNSPENLLKFYINLSALEIYLKFLMSNYHGVAPPPPPQSVSSKHSLIYFTSQNIVHHTLEHFAVVML